jgi:hypothetical protein
MPLFTKQKVKDMAEKMTPDERQKLVNEEWAALSYEAQNEILSGALDARQIARHQLRSHWYGVGRALARIQNEAMRMGHTNNDHHPSYRRHHGLLMERVPDLRDLVAQDKASSVHARWMFETWAVLESWFAALDPGVNEKLNHPSAIRRRYDAAEKTKPQGAEKAPTPMARKDARIAELQAELDEKEVEIRRLKRGQDNLTEGRDWSWNDSPEDIAAAFLLLQPTKAKRLGSVLLELSKSTAPSRRVTRSAKQTEDKPQADREAAALEQLNAWASHIKVPRGVRK